MYDTGKLFQSSLTLYAMVQIPTLVLGQVLQYSGYYRIVLSVQDPDYLDFWGRWFTQILSCVSHAIKFLCGDPSATRESRCGISKIKG